MTCLKHLLGREVRVQSPNFDSQSPKNQKREIQKLYLRQTPSFGTCVTRELNSLTLVDSLRDQASCRFRPNLGARENECEKGYRNNYEMAVERRLIQHKDR